MTSIDALRLSTRCRQCLNGDDITTIEKLRSMKRVELMHIPGFGSRSAREVEDALKRWDKDERDGLHQFSQTKITTEILKVRGQARGVRSAIDSLVQHLRVEGKQLDQWAHELEQLRRFERDQWRFDREHDRLLTIERIARKLVDQTDHGRELSPAGNPVLEELRLALLEPQPT